MRRAIKFTRRPSKLNCGRAGEETCAGAERLLYSPAVAERVIALSTEHSHTNRFAKSLT